MIYQGQTLSVKTLENGMAELCFDNSNEPVNKLNAQTLDELRQAIASIEAATGVRGLLISSAKTTFIVGADINEFVEMFGQPDELLVGQLIDTNQIFNHLEDLPVPTVSLINGAAMGGGMEVCLATDYRIASSTASIGLPEVKLGINPGFGGTVRTPRVIGVDNAVEMICTGNAYKAAKALAVGAVDAVVEADQLHQAGVALLADILDNKFDYNARREEKKSPVKLNDIERMMAFVTGKSVVAAQAGRNMPAPITAAKSMEQSVVLERDEAIKVEAQMFAKLAKTDAAAAMVGLFLNDQNLSRRNQALSKEADTVNQAGVLGAGIMGGGIAYQSAYKGTSILMKDIAEDGLQLGMREASKLLAKQVERGRLTGLKMGEVLSNIRPTLTYDGFDKADIIVEAVVENPNVKKSVLAETEKHIDTNAVLASNTSTISITELATALERPENFCGMHFFNPVHKMPLVEVIRGEKTSEATVAKTVAYALKMGKTPIVVNDCAGFFVNRVLFPYFAGFNLLVRDGLDFKRVDKIMETFGWPMGPAYLMDVVGIDTGKHAGDVMAQAFPDRMLFGGNHVSEIMFQSGRFGQKNGAGFYQYVEDKKGRPVKQLDEAVEALIAPAIENKLELSDEQIIDRMMIPMINEVVRCIEEGIVGSASDADLGLIMGLGFPVFRGGAIRYLDTMGLAEFVAKADQYKELGALYEPSDKLRQMAANNESFF